MVLYLGAHAPAALAADERSLPLYGQHCSLCSKLQTLQPAWWTAVPLSQSQYGRKGEEEQEEDEEEEEQDQWREGRWRGRSEGASRDVSPSCVRRRSRRSTASPTKLRASHCKARTHSALETSGACDAQQE
ncbi:unnamed protein product [Prorocentrum cordatum]|uniref:Secreted protein n=1 Tax=Prorocentrum cordatum TaxID=2364126 RepID=A0ABN9RJV9_9DINO|nr:unnamed protein product [Polarella glacialis]